MAGNGGNEDIRVSVVYALPDRQPRVELRVPPDTSVQEVVRRSGLLERFPEIDRDSLSCAIYGRAAQLTDAVHEGDRIEILRPLKIDPKESRRQAAARSRTTGRR